MKLLKRILKRRRWRMVLSVLAVLVVGGMAYGQTVEMYFWQDDSALIFKLQHPEGAAGSFGAGIIGEGAYKYLVVPFAPFFPIFRLNPEGYFAIGWVWYLVAVAAFYWLAVGLFQKRGSAFAITLIFAAGYVGSEIMFRIINSWQSGIGLALALVSFGGLVRCLRGKGIRYYFLAVLAFWAATEFVYIRSHSLIAVFIAIFVVLAWPGRSLRKWLVFVAGQVPFVVIFYEKYLVGGGMGIGGMGKLAGSLLSGKVEMLSGLLATVGNVFVPDAWQGKLIKLFGNQVGWVTLAIFGVGLVLWLTVLGATKKMRALALVGLLGGFLINHYFAACGLYWFRSREAVLAGAMGWYMCVVVAVLTGSYWKKRRDLALGIALGWVMAVASVFGYFIQYQDAIFGTTHRYLHYSLVGYALLWGAVGVGVCEEWAKRKAWRFLGVLPLAFVVGSNLFLGFRYQSQIVAWRSEPTRQFYRDLKKFVSQAEVGSVFYFDVARDAVSQQQFRDFFSVGSMPESTAIAIYYLLDRDDVKVLTNFDELLFEMFGGRVDVDKLYTFYYDRQGLVNTTEEVRKLLNSGSGAEELIVNPGSPVTFSVKRTKPFTLMELAVRARVSPDIAGVKYPYGMGSNSGEYSLSEKEGMLNYLLARKEYYARATVNSLSEWKYQEVGYAVDNNPGTSWRGHRIFWHENHHEQIVVDLGVMKTVSQLVWTNWNHTLTPTSYTIDVSGDKKNWTTVKRVTGGPERGDGEVVIEKWESRPARYVRMDITDTLGNDAPALSELEVIEAKDDDVNIKNSLEFIKQPFVNVKDEQEMKVLLSKVAPLLKLRVEWNVDDGGQAVELPVGDFDRWQTFNFLLAAKGREIKRMTVAVPDAPVKVEVMRVELRNVSFEEAKRKGWIMSFSKN